MASRKPSAALSLGVLSGAVAAAFLLAFSIPLTHQVTTIYETQAVNHAESAAAHGARLFQEEGGLSPGLEGELPVHHLQVRSPDGLLAYQVGVDVDAIITQAACSSPEGAVYASDDRGEWWAAACTEVDGNQIIAAWNSEGFPAARMLYLVLLLAAAVGIVTSLVVLRLLAPISRVSRALDRVGAGERGVRLASTGLAELDDLVERLNAAARAMEAREDAVVERISAVQEMARMVAHEVRNPLQSLELLASLVASEEEAEERHEIVRSIHNEVRSLDMVVNRLLRQGAVGTGLQLILMEDDLVPLLEQVIKVRTPEAQTHGISLELAQIPRRIRVPMDQALLGRSLENLVLNAMQYVPPNKGRVRLWAATDGEWVDVGVEDNGPGVDPDLAPHIFDANVSGRTGGTGLGLALVKGVVEAHGGTIQVDRSSLGGARFTLRIPITREVHGTPEAEGPGSR